MVVDGVGIWIAQVHSPMARARLSLLRSIAVRSSATTSGANTRSLTTARDGAYMLSTDDVAGVATSTVVVLSLIASVFDGWSMTPGDNTLLQSILTLIVILKGPNKVPRLLLPPPPPPITNKLRNKTKHSRNNLRVGLSAPASSLPGTTYPCVGEMTGLGKFKSPVGHSLAFCLGSVTLSCRHAQVIQAYFGGSVKEDLYLCATRGISAMTELASL